MNRNKKIAIAVASGVGLVATGIALSAVVHLPWGAGSSHWSHVRRPQSFVTMQPKHEDVAGVYQLTEQTISTNGLAILDGRLCQLELRSDGSFTATNYPRWASASSATLRIAEFISTSGRWRCDTVGMIYDGQQCWGVVFSDTDIDIDSLALRRKGENFTTSR